MDKKPEYIICPRCDLNYILKKDKYCDVCKAEMGLVDRSFLLGDLDEAEDDAIICPICNTNYCEEGEDMCIVCRKDNAAKEKQVEKDWDDNIDVDATDIADEEMEVSLSQLEEEEEEEADDTGEYKSVVDDFEYVDVDDTSIDDLDDEEEDEDTDLDI